MLYLNLYDGEHNDSYKSNSRVIWCIKWIWIIHRNDCSRSCPYYFNMDIHTFIPLDAGEFRHLYILMVYTSLTSGGVRENMFKKIDGGIDMVSLILTVVIAAVTMMVGLVVVANMESSMPSISTSVLSTSLTSVLTNTGTAFNFLALGLFVLAAVFIIGIVAGVLGKGE